MRMAIKGRAILAVGVFVLLGALVAARPMVRNATGTTAARPGQNRGGACDQRRRPGPRNAARGPVPRRRRDRSQQHLDRGSADQSRDRPAGICERPWGHARRASVGGTDRRAGSEHRARVGHLGPEYLDRRDHHQKLSRGPPFWFARCTFDLRARPSRPATSAWRLPTMPAIRCWSTATS